MVTIIWAINLFGRVLIYLLLARAVLSWVVNPYRTNPQSFLFKLNSFIIGITEPIVMPFRKLMSRFNTGMLDLSLFVTMLAILIIQRILVTVLIAFL